MPILDGRSDPLLSDERIDAAPAPLKALFQDYAFWDVIAAIGMVGLNDDPSKFTPEQIEQGAADALKILQADGRKRLEELLRGG